MMAAPARDHLYGFKIQPMKMISGEEAPRRGMGAGQNSSPLNNLLRGATGCFLFRGLLFGVA